MCRWVDLGSTNTSFLSCRFIGSVSSASLRPVGTRPPQVWVGDELPTRYPARADKSTNAGGPVEPQGRGTRPAAATISWRDGAPPRVRPAGSRPRVLGGEFPAGQAGAATPGTADAHGRARPAGGTEIGRAHV